MGFPSKAFHMDRKRTRTAIPPVEQKALLYTVQLCPRVAWPWPCIKHAACVLVPMPEGHAGGWGGGGAQADAISSRIPSNNGRCTRRPPHGIPTQWGGCAHPKEAWEPASVSTMTVLTSSQAVPK